MADTEFGEIRITLDIAGATKQEISDIYDRVIEAACGCKPLGDGEWDDKMCRLQLASYSPDELDEDMADAR